MTGFRGIFLSFGLLMPLTLHGKIQVHREDYVEKIKTKKNGKVVKVIENAVKVAPGQDVTFKIVYKNTGSQPAKDVVIKNPVPKHTVFKSGKTTSGDPLEVSVDNGKKYGALKDLKVREKINNRTKRRAALAKDVTHVRVRLTKALKPNESGELKIRTTLK